MYATHEVEVVLGAVRDPGVEVAIADRVVRAIATDAGAQVGVRAGDVLLEAGLERQREAAFELGAPRRDLLLHLRGPDVVERVDDDLGLAEASRRARARARPRCVAPGWSLASMRSCAMLL